MNTLNEDTTQEKEIDTRRKKQKRKTPQRYLGFTVRGKLRVNKKGQGPPKMYKKGDKNKRVQTSITVRKGLIEKLDWFIEREGDNRSYIFERLLENFLVSKGVIKDDY